jgi:hypothetical protein
MPVLTITVWIMKHVINPGDKYGRLTVIREVQKAAADGRRYRAALCRRDCGKEITPRISSLYSGDARSCGCLRGQPKYQHKRCPVCGTPAMIWRDRRGCSRICGYQPAEPSITAGLGASPIRPVSAPAPLCSAGGGRVLSSQFATATETTSASRHWPARSRMGWVQSCGVPRDGAVPHALRCASTTPAGVPASLTVTAAGS